MAVNYRPYTQQRKSPLQALAGSGPQSFSRVTPGAGGLATASRAPNLGPQDPWDRYTRTATYPHTVDYQNPQADPNNQGGTTSATPDDSNPYASDPIYQQLIAMANKNDQDAQAEALAQRKDLAINLGDGSIVGLGMGTGTGDAAQANAFSTLKNLLRTHNTNDRGIDSGTNKANLFYSSTRGRDLQQEQTGYQGGQAQAYALAHQQLTQIAAALLAQERADAQARADAASGAYDRHKNDQQAVADPGSLTNLLRQYGG